MVNNSTNIVIICYLLNDFKTLHTLQTIMVLFNIIISSSIVKPHW